MTPTVTKWDEDRVLDYFWLMASERGDRLDLLKQLGAVQLERPSEWDAASVRQAIAGVRITLTADSGCFTCLSQERRIHWHHVIWVTHGGSNNPRNLVPLCHRCHRELHPWLDEPTSREQRWGWTAIGDMAAFAWAKLRSKVSSDR